MKRLLMTLILAFLFLSNNLLARSMPFNISIEPFSIPELVGLQSFAFGQDKGKLLIIGGRTDGLHRRQPFASFASAGRNTQLTVIDPIARQKWTAPLSSLPASLSEQLSSTNMEFYQNGNYLYLVGGYGYSATAKNHITFSNLTAVDVSAVIKAIIENKDFKSYFRQITDEQFAVTGGHLEKINNTYYLVGGQKFTGRYNPMGPDHGPGFSQQYTNQIRKFSLNDNGTTISINHLPPMTDAVNLHRRDFNVAPQILPNGEEGLTAFSGVFQTNIELPYLNSVNIDSKGYAVNDAFTQYYNHYDCPIVPVYSAADKQMHTVFFGGIAQYFDNAGTLAQNNKVPFVKTVARVTREANGTMAEYKLPFEMPAFLGAGAEFIPLENLPKYANGVIKLDNLTNETNLIGYIYGGINSLGKTIFWRNDGTQSTANNQVFKVFLTRNKSQGVDILNKQSIGTLKMKVFPNLPVGNLVVKYTLSKSTDVKISLSNISGKKIEEKTFKNLPIGENTFEKKIENLASGGVYLLTIETSYERAKQEIVVEP